MSINSVFAIAVISIAVLYLIGLAIQSALNHGEQDDDYSAFESTYETDSIPNT